MAAGIHAALSGGILMCTYSFSLEKMPLRASWTSCRLPDRRGARIVGKVIGSIVSTRKCENLIGNKFMIIEPLKEMAGDCNQFVAIDNIGAGIGETVLVATGSAARVGMEGAPVDAAIVGIVDE